VQDSSENLSNRAVIINLARDNRVPAIYPYLEYVEAGGLMAYAVDLLEQGRHAARQVDEILKGAKPSDIPFVQVTKFSLLINLQAAKASGFDIPPTLLARADEVIE